MFDFENVIHQIELTDPRTICVVGKHKSGRDEILELSLPEKLTVAPSHEGLVKNSDLRMKSGGFTIAPVIQMKALWNQRKVIVSEKDQIGAAIYNLGSEDSDLITRFGSLTCDLVTPLMALNNQELVLLTTRTKRDLVAIDLTVNTMLYKLSVDSTSETQCGFEPSFVSENLAALCERNGGSVFLHDVRAGKMCGNFSPAKQNLGNKNIVTRELWTVSTGYINKTSSSSANGENSNPKLGLLSAMGKLLIYDIRNTDIAMCESDIGKFIDIASRAENANGRLPVMNFSPDDMNRVSLSGFDENVYIYDASCTETFKTIFVHDGHVRQSDQLSCCVTSHMWYKENIVISASDNCWLHCWQFIPDALS
ncbi:WD repeat-containing protein 73 isoform X3 [Cryptotermes secundus]|nr:WD repeat-containing protein 73 isoform X3 [Cryptotermes secundus]